MYYDAKKDLMLWGKYNPQSKPKHIYELVPFASMAVRAMITGLRNQAKRNDFVIDMTNFGSCDSKGTCFGCAATCTIQEIAQKSLPSDRQFTNAYDRAKLLNLEQDSIWQFEKCIDGLRGGYVYGLLDYYRQTVGRNYGNFCCKHTLERLSSPAWEKHLGAYERLADDLEVFEQAHFAEATQ